MFYFKSNFLLICFTLLQFSVLGQPSHIPESYQDQPIYKVVEESPRFLSNGCERNKSTIEKQHCSKFALKNYIKSNLRYPKEAKEKNISGIVLLEVIVEPDGKVKFSRMIRDIGGGCAEEAKRLVEEMPKWIPGKLRGKYVRVQTPLTIKFDLG